MRRFSIVGGVLLGLVGAAPGLACSYPYAPEPVGGPSAMFIAKRMVDAATYVDLAVAERAEPMQTPDGRGLAAQSVTFRVVERLKGASPEHFTLFAIRLKPAGAAVEPVPLLHWVDEKTGGIYPHSTPWEIPPTEQFSSTSCDPGFIEPVSGRTYLVFRGADGGLLGPVGFHAGQRPVRGFAFVDAQLPAASEWTRAVRFQSHSPASGRTSAPADDLPPPVQVDPSRGSASFRRLLTEAEARELLKGAGVRPYVVYMSVRGLAGEYRIADEKASLDAITGARRHIAATIGATHSRRGGGARIRGLLEEYTAEQLARDPQKLEYARRLIASLARAEETAAEARSDAPFIYGVEFLGDPAAHRKLASSPDVSEIRKGFIVRGRGTAPQPQNLGYVPPDPAVPPGVAALSAAEIYARLQALVSQ